MLSMIMITSMKTLADVDVSLMMNVVAVVGCNNHAKY